MVSEVVLLCDVPIQRYVQREHMLNKSCTGLQTCWIQEAAAVFTSVCAVFGLAARHSLKVSKCCWCFGDRNSASQIFFPI